MFLKFMIILSSITLLSGCGQYEWGWYVIDPSTSSGRANIIFLISGLLETILVAVVSMLFALVLGLVVVIPALSQRWYWQFVNRSYVELVRAIPVLVLLLWVYYGLPALLDIRINHFWAGVLALTLAESAFMAEVFRGGIQSIEEGQHEAAEALGLTYIQKMRWIILPQAIRRVLPSLGNQFIYILKMSSLVSVIGLSELTRRANELVITEYRPLEIYTFLVLEYLLLILVLSQLIRYFERRLAVI